MFYYEKIALEVPESIYEPQEDSILIAKILEKYNLKGKKCLDIGCGSGLLGILMAKKGCIVTACDINASAVKITKRNAASNGVKISTVRSDLFSAIKGEYDFIAFNPPYLPTEDNVKHKEQWSGGANGREVIEKFLHDLPNNLNKKGKVIMVFSSLTGEKEVRDLARENGFAFRVIARQKIPWEELILAELVIAQS